LAGFFHISHQAGMDEFEFLTVDDVLEIHSDQLRRYGGSEGVLDNNVVLSAAGSAEVSMYGQYLNADITEMAASYLFGFAASQGFVDGNKRTGAACAAEFLARNGYQLDCLWEELYDITMRVATKRADKQQVAAWIADRLAPIS
jgi:death-on-curing protein